MAESPTCPDPGAYTPDGYVFGSCTTKPDGLKYTILGETTTWDHPLGCPFEGYTSQDMTVQTGAMFRQMTNAKWYAEGNVDMPPYIHGVGFALGGVTTSQADSLGWAAGVGYGNDVCQRLTSPQYVYDGTGGIDLAFAYFNQSQVDRDFTRVYVEAGASRVDITHGGFSGDIGIDGATGVITPAAFAYMITNADLGGGTAARAFSVGVEFASDLGSSDEDGGVDTWYGPFGLDDFTIGPVNLEPFAIHTYDFEADLQGWVPGVCPGVGSYFGIADINLGYNILDPCPCSLTGNVVKLHNSSGGHPNGQHERIISPIIDREEDIPGGEYLAYNRIVAQWDQYADLPLQSGVFYRPGWLYFPYRGIDVWSPRVGIATYYYSGGAPKCETLLNVGTDWGLPSGATHVKFVYELYAGWGATGGIPVSRVNNCSPLIDNVRIVNVRSVSAPGIRVATGMKFQDGFGQSVLGVLSSADPGNADVVYDMSRSDPLPSSLADNLVILGPPPTSASSRWEARLWFRLNRVGPAQASNATYNVWHGAVAAAKGEFVGADVNFAWGYMDSVETGRRVQSSSRYWFCSRFRDGPSTGGAMLPADDNYNWGGTGEFGSGNAILPDLAFTPGTKVQYFVTSNYIYTPTTYRYLPDTTGRNYFEFEILPSFRREGETDRFPCMLYIDAYDGRCSPDAQYFIERGLNIALHGASSDDPIPDPTTWDRYDYGDASSNWNAPFYRTTGGNNGATIPQMLGYKLIMVNTGLANVGCMEPRDWQGFQQWMEGVLCDGNVARQGFIANGNGISEIINADYPSFLARNLGATHSCRSYSDAGCPGSEAENDESYCTRLGQVPGPFNGGIPTDVWANWCPARQFYSVLSVNTAVPTAVGNKYYEMIGAPGVTAEYAQVINDRLAAADKYRTVIDGFSYHMLIRPNPDAVPPLSANDCRYPTSEQVTSARIDVAAKELENAITWTMGGIPGLCVNPCLYPSGAPEGDGASGVVTRLYQNRPNPFNPRTEIRFSLAADCRVKLIIYDVSGRRVRTLVDNSLKAGTHSMIWDGADDYGRAVTSGVYWSRLQAGEYTSNRKMIVLK